MADKPKVQFTKADLYGLVQQNVNTLKPPAQAQPMDRYAKLREALQRGRMRPGGPTQTV